MSEIDLFIRAAIYGQIFTDVYRVAGLREFYPTEDFNHRGISSLLIFHAGCVCGAFINYQSSQSLTSLPWPFIRNKTLWLSLFLWWLGNAIIGFMYQIEDWDYITTHDTTTPALLSQSWTSWALTCAFIDFFGGVFYAGTLGMDLVRSQNNAFALLLIVITTPFFGYMLNINFLNISNPKGSYLYAYRLMTLQATVAIIYRILANPLEYNEQNKQYTSLSKNEEKRGGGGNKPWQAQQIELGTSVWMPDGVVHMLGLLLFSCVCYLPLVAFSQLIGLDMTNYGILLHALMGGQFCGSVIYGIVCARFVYNKRWETRTLHNSLVTFACTLFLLLFAIWTIVDKLSVLFTFTYGVVLGILTTWYLVFAAFKQCDISNKNSVFITDWFFVSMVVQFVGVGIGMGVIDSTTNVDVWSTVGLAMTCCLLVICGTEFVLFACNNRI